MTKSTRRDLLRRGIAVSGGVAATLGGAPILPALERAFAQARDDRAILVAAAGLEQTTAFVYQEASRHRGLSERMRSLADYFAGQDREHAAAWITALERLGGIPPDRPTSVAQIPGLRAALTAGDRATMRLALGLEQQAIRLYYGAVRGFRDSKFQETAALIMANEGEKIVVLRQGLGRPPVPEAFATGGPVRPGA